MGEFVNDSIFFGVGNFNHPKLGTMLMVGLTSRGYTKTMEGGMSTTPFLQEN